MTGWIIFGCIALFLIILFRQSITVTVDYENKLDIKVKFLFFTIYPAKPKKKKKPKKEKKKKSEADKKPVKTEEAAEEKTAEQGADKEAPQEAEAPDGKKKKSKKKKLNIDIEMIMDYVKNAWPPVKKLFKKIRWYDIYIDWVVASDDAAKTALQYGGICAFLYPFFEWLTTYFTAHVKEVHIEPDFSKEKQDVFIYFVLKLRLSTALACVIWLAWRVLKTYMKYDKGEATAPKKKSGKQAKKPKSNKKGK